MKKTSSEVIEILKQIKTIRKQRGLTQEKVAEIIGVERSTYVRKESGAIPLTLSEFIKISDFLEIDYSINDGSLQLQPKVSKDLMNLVDLIQTISKADKTYIIESTKNLIKHTKKGV